jgi:hypothetical protein
VIGWWVEINKTELLRWNSKYDSDHPWWVQKEEELGNRFRKTNTITKNDLFELIEWKFKELPGRRKRVIGIAENNSEETIQRTCKQVFDMTSNQDSTRIRILDHLDGVGPAMASVILTFYDPKNYGIHDIHVWREFFGQEPSTIFIGNTCYLKLLSEMRKIAAKYSLDVRTVEKAYFKKNLDNSS